MTWRGPRGLIVQSWPRQNVADSPNALQVPIPLQSPKPPHPWHYFQLKDQKIFGFAGLYNIWKDKQTGKEIRSYTIITTEPNATVGKYHDRMPVILDLEDEEMWLNPDISEPGRLLPLLKQYPADKMEEWRVGDEARNPRNDYPEVIKPYKSSK
jgi:putative SOS response-associated peptidase YedK